MHRRTFLLRTGAVTISISGAFGDALAARSTPDRVGMGTVIFVWSHDLESHEEPYLQELRAGVKAAGAELINVQVDAERIAGWMLERVRANL